MEVAGLIKGQILYPIMYKGIAQDTMTVKEGIWKTNDDTTNVPTDLYRYGVLCVFNAEDFSVRLWSNNNKKIYIRTVVSGVDTGWLSLIN